MMTAVIARMMSRPGNVVRCEATRKTPERLSSSGDRTRVSERAPHQGTPTQFHRFAAMSERADACRRQAAECERAAIIATDLPVRLMYLDLARQWREMAEQTIDLEQQRAAQRERQ